MQIKENRKEKKKAKKKIENNILAYLGAIYNHSTTISRKVAFHCVSEIDWNSFDLKLGQRSAHRAFGFFICFFLSHLSER